MSCEEHRELCKVTKNARVAFEVLCVKKPLQKNQVYLDQMEEYGSTENLIQIVKSRRQKQLEDFILAFINRTEDPIVTQSVAHLLLLLVGDVSISTVVPFAYHYPGCQLLIFKNKFF